MVGSSANGAEMGNHVARRHGLTANRIELILIRKMRPHRQVRPFSCGYTLALLLLLGACTQQPTINRETLSFQGAMPANLDGSWERDYSRGSDVHSELRRLYNQMSRAAQQRTAGGPYTDVGISAKAASSIQALAQLADEITRPDVLTISQNEYEIIVERKDDFAMLCEFFGGVSKGTESVYGSEVCGWDQDQLVSYLTLPDGLTVIHRFTISDDRNYLRVVTTVASTTSRLPFTLSRFYRKFEPTKSEFNCVETLSMKRVCSTGEINP